MIDQTKCIVCGRTHPTIHCGTKTKSRLKQNEKRTENHICQYCKKKGTGQYTPTHTNTKQHSVYFNEDMED